MTARLQAGCTVKKVGRDGRTRSTTLRLSEDEASLSWTGRLLSLSPKSADERTVQVANLVSVEATGLNPWGDNSPLSVTLVIDTPPECSVGSRSNSSQPAGSPSLDSPRASALGSSSARSNSLALRADGRGTLTLIFDSGSPEAVADFGVVVAALQSLVPARNSARRPDEAERSRLLAMFPDVDPPVVLSVLEACGDGAVARQRLLEMMSDGSELPPLKVMR